MQQTGSRSANRAKAQHQASPDVGDSPSHSLLVFAYRGVRVDMHPVDHRGIASRQANDVSLRKREARLHTKPISPLSAASFDLSATTCVNLVQGGGTTRASAGCPARPLSFRNGANTTNEGRGIQSMPRRASAPEFHYKWNHARPRRSCSRVV